jgi:hypothetical protein
LNDYLLTVYHPTGVGVYVIPLTFGRARIAVGNDWVLDDAY